MQELAALAMGLRTLGNGAGAAAEGGVCISIDFTHVKPLHQHVTQKATRLLTTVIGHAFNLASRTFTELTPEYDLN